MKKITFLIMLFSAFVNAQDYLMTGDANISTCSGTFYDSGGATGNYSANENFTVTFCPLIPGTFSQFEFTEFLVEGQPWDFMFIYNGPDTSSELIGEFGTKSPLDCSGIIASSHPSGCLTVHFQSDSSQSRSGWAATISCSPFPAPAPANSVCSGAVPFCANSGPLEFPNNSNSICLPGAPQVILDNTCLIEAPNPAWYYLEIATSGSIEMEIIQNSLPGGSGIGLDVDFAMWGPFSNTSSACSDFTLGNCTDSHDCTGNVVDCSYSTSAIETATIPNAVAGEIYMVLITNFQGTPGFIRVNQTNAGSPGAGATDCHVICPTFAGTNPTTCNGSDGSIVVSGLSSGNSYSISYLDDGTPVTLNSVANSAGKIVISGLNAGNYSGILTDVAGCTTPGNITLVTGAAAILSSINAPNSVCSGSLVNFILQGTPNATVSYHLNTGSTQTLILDASGSGTVPVTSMTIPTTLFATAISIPGCSTTISLSENVLITSGPSLIHISTSGLETQIVCPGFPIIPIIYNIVNAGTVVTTVLPAGLTGVISSGQFTISGIPTQAGANVFIADAVGVCGVASANGTITVNSPMTIQQVAPTSNLQTVCKDVPIIPFEYLVGNGASGASVTGLPLGLSGTYTNGTYKISGASTQTGTFNFSVAPTGSCTGPTLGGTLIVDAISTLQLQSGTENQQLCSNSALTPITYQITGASSAVITGLPNGVSGIVSGSTVTISGTPTQFTTFTYNVATVGGCTVQNAQGTISFKPEIVFGAPPASASQSICVGNSAALIQFQIQNSVNASVLGLPSGMIGSYSAGLFTITGTPTVAAGTFPYVVTATGDCDPETINGIITITGASVMTLQSPSASQSVCKNQNLTAIAYNVSNGVTQVISSGFPSGITGTLSGTVYTISGTSSLPGNYPYTLTTVGGCSSVTSNGIITITEDAKIDHLVITGSQAQSVCVGLPIFPISYQLSSGATNASVTGLPSGLNLSILAGIATISGSSATAGIFPYTISTSGGCSSASKSGTITVNLPATALLSYSNLVYCNEENALISASVSGTGNFTGGTFAVTPPGLNVSPITGKFNPLQSASGNYLITYTSAPSGGCPSINAFANVTVYPTPDVIATPALNAVCSEELTSIALSSSVPGTTFTWTVVQNNASGAQNGSGNIINQQLFSNSINQGTVIYKITPTSPQGCVGTTVDLSVKVNPLPVVSLQDGVVCLNFTTGTVGIPYVLNAGLNNSNYDFEWFRNGSQISGATGNTYSAEFSGLYKVLARNISTGCMSEPAEANVTESMIANSLILEGNTAFAENPTVTITVPIPGNYEFQLDNGSFQTSNVFTGLGFGDHEIKVIDDFNCTDFTYIFTVIGYPKFFTPNGDTYNDSWNIVGLPDSAQPQIFIYDRYGKLLRQISNSGEGWDGKYNGQELPATDYWFTVDYTDQQIRKQFKSHFSLKR